MRENYSYKQPTNAIAAAATGLKLGMDQGIEKVQLRSIIAERIKAVRLDAKLTQEDFAVSIGSNHLTYRGYENRKSEVPIVLLLRIANLYHVSMDYLTGRTDNKDGRQPENSMGNTDDRIEQLEKTVAQLLNALGQK